MTDTSNKKSVSDIERLHELLQEVDEIIGLLQSKGLHFTGGFSGVSDKISPLFQAPFSTFVGVSDGAAQFGLEVPCEDINEYLHDQGAYWAKRYGISKTHFEKWAEVRKNGQSCWALTKKNLPCRSVMVPEAPDDPSEYDPGKPIYCPVHENYTMDVVSDSVRRTKSE